MSRWSEFDKKQKKPALDQVEVTDSHLSCQTCGEIVTKGVYLPSEKVLTWKCSSEHVSIIEKFNI